MAILAPTPRYLFLTQHLDLPTASGVDDAQWEHFQVAHLCDDGRYRIEDKSRQIAWSFLVAMEAVAVAILHAESTVFVSFNLDEASEKIRYAKTVLANIHNYKLPGSIRDNTFQMEFDNGARIMSLPSREPRGKARMNVVLDEFCHIPRDQAIYSAALPMMSKGGRMRIGSSLLGASGQHWEISQEKLRPYPGFTHSVTPWWKVKAFCTDVRTAFVQAPNMPTAERVARFGNERVVSIHDNMHTEDFQREYECVYVDETSSWFTWEEIRAMQSPLYTVKSTSKGSNVSNALAAVRELALAVGRGQVETVFAGGTDVGRTRNTTEIFLVGCTTTGHMPLRLTISLDGVPFPLQRDVMQAVLSSLPIKKLFIDRNGIGRNLADDLEKLYPTKAEGVDFTNQSKMLWATDAKMLAQQGIPSIPEDRDLAYQIHSIKRLITSSKNMLFDTERNEKHHADMFWAWALALAAGRVKVMVPRVF